MSLNRADYNEIFKNYRSVSTAVVSDNLDREPGAVGIEPVNRYESPMVGRALTVRTRAGDNLYIHRALDLIEPGDVLVIDGEGDTSRALVGEIIMEIARVRHASGFVIDGSIRDVDEITASDFPIFCRSRIHRGPYKNGPGEINVPVCVGGMVINPGDIVIGDADGVVAFDPAIADSLLVGVRKQEDKEKRILSSIADGSYTDAYAVVDT